MLLVTFRYYSTSQLKIYLKTVSEDLKGLVLFQLRNVSDTRRGVCYLMHTLPIAGT